MSRATVMKNKYTTGSVLTTHWSKAIPVTACSTTCILTYYTECMYRVHTYAHVHTLYIHCTVTCVLSSPYTSLTR